MQAVLTKEAEVEYQRDLRAHSPMPGRKKINNPLSLPDEPAAEGRRNTGGSGLNVFRRKKSDSSSTDTETGKKNRISGIFSRNKRRSNGSLRLDDDDVTSPTPPESPEAPPAVPVAAKAPARALPPVSPLDTAVAVSPDRLLLVSLYATPSLLRVSPSRSSSLLQSFLLTLCLNDTSLTRLHLPNPYSTLSRVSLSFTDNTLTLTSPLFP